MAKWIPSREFENLPPINVFHKEHDGQVPPPSPYQNCHILFRREVEIPASDSLVLHITADDFYKLWIDGEYVDPRPLTLRTPMKTSLI